MASTKNLLPKDDYHRQGTMFEHISRHPIFQFWCTPGCRMKCPFYTSEIAKPRVRKPAGFHKEVYFGPFRSANRTLATPDSPKKSSVFQRFSSLPPPPLKNGRETCRSSKNESGLPKVFQKSAEPLGFYTESTGRFCRTLHIVKSLWKKGSAELWEPSPSFSGPYKLFSQHCHTSVAEITTKAIIPKFFLVTTRDFQKGALGKRCFCLSDICDTKTLQIVNHHGDCNVAFFRGPPTTHHSHKRPSSSRWSFMGVVCELLEPKKNAKYAPPPVLHSRNLDRRFLWGWCVDFPVRFLVRKGPLGLPEQHPPFSSFSSISAEQSPFFWGTECNIRILADLRQNHLFP